MIDIDTMPAGPELDRLVAEKVMGWRLECFANASRTPMAYSDKNAKIMASADWSPSTNIAHAWGVVEHLERMGGLISNMYSQGGCWSVGIEPMPESNLHPCYRAIGSTAPLAICRAAIKAAASLPA